MTTFFNLCSDPTHTILFVMQIQYFKMWEYFIWQILMGLSKVMDGPYIYNAQYRGWPYVQFAQCWNPGPQYYIISFKAWICIIRKKNSSCCICFITKMEKEYPIWKLPLTKVDWSIQIAIKKWSCFLNLLWATSHYKSCFCKYILYASIGKIEIYYFRARAIEHLVLF